MGRSPGRGNEAAGPQGRVNLRRAPLGASRQIERKERPGVDLAVGLPGWNAPLWNSFFRKPKSVSIVGSRTSPISARWSERWSEADTMRPLQRCFSGDWKAGRRGTLLIEIDCSRNGRRLLAALRLFLAFGLDGIISPSCRSSARSALPGRIPNIADLCLLHGQTGQGHPSDGSRP